MNPLTFRNRAAFREWLTQNALSETGVWLAFSKRTPPDTITAGEALEEALCFGWIDGQMQRVDGQTYLKYFKQRAPGSNWSEKNKKLVAELETKNLMTDLGRAKVACAKQTGNWVSAARPQLTGEQMQQFWDMLQPFEPACANFAAMTPSVRKTYAGSYFFGPKTEEGRRRRFDTIVERLTLNLNPMESLKKAAKSSE